MENEELSLTKKHGIALQIILKKKNAWIGSIFFKDIVRSAYQIKLGNKICAIYLLNRNRKYIQNYYYFNITESQLKSIKKLKEKYQSKFSIGLICDNKICLLYEDNIISFFLKKAEKGKSIAVAYEKRHAFKIMNGNSKIITIRQNAFPEKLFA